MVALPHWTRLRASYGTPIRAVKGWVALYAGNSGDWAGNHVAIKHADGKTTMYSHMSSMSARAGQTVQAGDVIGRVGETGRAFGAHLHFELYPAGVKYGDVYKAINPQPWLAANGVTARTQLQVTRKWRRTCVGRAIPDARSCVAPPRPPATPITMRRKTRRSCRRDRLAPRYVSVIVSEASTV